MRIGKSNLFVTFTVFSRVATFSILKDHKVYYLYFGYDSACYLLYFEHNSPFFQQSSESVDGVSATDPALTRQGNCE